MSSTSVANLADYEDALLESDYDIKDIEISEVAGLVASIQAHLRNAQREKKILDTADEIAGILDHVRNAQRVIATADEISGILGHVRNAQQNKLDAEKNAEADKAARDVLDECVNEVERFISDENENGSEAPGDVTGLACSCVRAGAGPKTKCAKCDDLIDDSHSSAAGNSTRSKSDNEANEAVPKRRSQPRPKVAIKVRRDKENPDFWGMCDCRQIYGGPRRKCGKCGDTITGDPYRSHEGQLFRKVNWGVKGTDRLGDEDEGSISPKTMVPQGREMGDLGTEDAGDVEAAGSTSPTPRSKRTRDESFDGSPAGIPAAKRLRKEN